MKRLITGVLVTVGLLIAVGGGEAAAATPLLPDLAERAPTQIGVVSDYSVPTFHLGFDTAAENVGAGPLIIDGDGNADGSGTMPAYQVIADSAGGRTSQPPVGSLRFDTDPTHDHWHFQGFERYELRSTDTYALVAPDHKVGFCLADDFWAYNSSPGPAGFDGWGCGIGSQSTVHIEEGITPGWGDEYVPQREGQYIDVTNVPAGVYYLVVRVNPDRLFQESDYTNDNSSALISIEWPGGPSNPPLVTVLRRCAGAETCPALPQVEAGPPPPPPPAGAPPVTPPQPGAAAVQTPATIAPTGAPARKPALRILTATASPGGTIALRVETPAAGLLRTSVTVGRVRRQTLALLERHVAAAGIWAETVHATATVRALLLRDGHARATVTVGFGAERRAVALTLSRRRLAEHVAASDCSTFCLALPGPALGSGGVAWQRLSFATDADWRPY